MRQFFYLFKQIGQPLLGHRNAQRLPDLTGGRSAHFLPCGQIGYHSRLRGDHCAVADTDVVGHADLSAKHYAIAELARAGDADLRDDQAAFSNDNIMRDLHEIINLCACADNRIAEFGAVNAAICADFDKILDNYAAVMRNKIMPTVKISIPKTG